MSHNPINETKIIFVEGLPGSGKSTTASWLASRLQSERAAVRLYLESQAEHPLNVGGDTHPAGSVPGDAFFQRYTPQSYVEESLRNWEHYLENTSQIDVIDIFDSYPYQNTVRILLQFDASIDFIHEYAARVEDLVKPMKPVLIYFKVSDTPQAVKHFNDISEQRGKVWAEYIEALITNCPFSLARNLSGASAVEAFISAYKQVADELLHESRLPRIILENCSGNWDGCYQQIEAFLELPSHS